MMPVPQGLQIPHAELSAADAQHGVRKRMALAAVREGDTLTVTKLDRLARSVPDALDILGQVGPRRPLRARRVGV
jgi:Resolvase, N terminal domain